MLLCWKSRNSRGMAPSVSNTERQGLQQGSVYALVFVNDFLKCC